MRYVHIQVIFLCIFHLTSFSQDVLYQYIPIPPQELNVNQLLYHIEEVTEVPLAYSNAIVEDRKLALQVDSMMLIKLLDTLFIERFINYYIYEGQLVLAPQMPARLKKNLICISGNISNEKTGKFIPYVNIYVPDQTTGTISNFNGEFEFYIPGDEDVDSIGISCLGYTQQFIPVNQFMQGKIDVVLKPLKFQINELIVRPNDPYDLVYLALSKKDENYSANTEVLTAFFRETTQKDDSYISLSEAAIEIYKMPYYSDDNDLVKLKKGRKERNLHANQEVNLVVEGGLYNSMLLDLMKYGVNFLDAEYMQFYTYEFLRQTSYNNRQTYSIAFMLKDQYDFIGFNGILYIDAITMGVVRVEFSIDQRSIAQAYPWMIKRVPKEFRVMPRYGDYKVEYRLYNDIWNLYYARSEIAIKLRKRKGKDKADKNTSLYKSSSEFVITGKSKGELDKIKYRDAAKPNDVLYEQIHSTDKEFWGVETVIVPEEPLIETIQKLWDSGLGESQNSVSNQE